MHLPQRTQLGHVVPLRIRAELHGAATQTCLAAAGLVVDANEQGVIHDLHALQELHPRQ